MGKPVAFPAKEFVSTLRCKPELTQAMVSAGFMSSDDDITETFDDREKRWHPLGAALFVITVSLALWAVLLAGIGVLLAVL